MAASRGLMEVYQPTNLAYQSSRLWHTKRSGYSEINRTIESQRYDCQWNRVAQIHDPFAQPASGCPGSGSKAQFKDE